MPDTDREPGDINQANEISQFNDKTRIRPIELDDSRGRWVFEPRANITALESVLIAHMFSAITVRYLKGDQSRFDWREYLTRDHALGYAAKLPSGIAVDTVVIELARHFRVLE